MNQFVRVPTSVDTQHFIQINACAFENRAPLQCCGSTLEYCVRVWRKLIRKWPRNLPNWPRNTRNQARLQSSVAYTISDKGTRFRHPDYDPDRAEKLISSSVSRHLSTHKISSKSMHAFVSNLSNRQADGQTNAGKRIYLLLRRR